LTILLNLLLDLRDLFTERRAAPKREKPFSMTGPMCWSAGEEL